MRKCKYTEILLLNQKCWYGSNKKTADWEKKISRCDIESSIYITRAKTPHFFRKRGESQAFGNIFGSKACFIRWINIEIGVKYRIENQLHRDWWLDANLMVTKCLGTKNGSKPMDSPLFHFFLPPFGWSSFLASPRLLLSFTHPNTRTLSHTREQFTHGGAGVQRRSERIRSGRRSALVSRTEVSSFIFFLFFFSSILFEMMESCFFSVNRCLILNAFLFVFVSSGLEYSISMFL
jgi:hypothetical protein